MAAYNIATGSAPSTDEKLPGNEKNVRSKRQRDREPPIVRNNETEEDDGPLSHESYIEKRRQAVVFCIADFEISMVINKCSCNGIHV